MNILFLVLSSWRHFDLMRSVETDNSAAIITKNSEGGRQLVKGCHFPTSSLVSSSAHSAGE